MTARLEPTRRGERGAALLVVLLLVSVMSITALGVAETVAYGARRSANVAARDQAAWYLLGAEELARSTIRRTFELDDEVTTLSQPWAVGPIQFDVESGLIEAELRDASNCFNLNSLAQRRDGGGYDVNEQAVQTLRHLLAALDVDPGAAARLANGAADWVDADERARNQGAEDYDYAFADPPYRTANGLFAEVDELRAISGVSEGVFRRVRPYLCARGDAEPARLNVNTLKSEDAPLLTALFEGRLSVDDAQDIIAERPDNGWRNADAFWVLEDVVILAVDESVRSQIGVAATHFELHARVQYLQAFAEAHTLFGVDAGGEARLIRRRMGTLL
ncbi:MAG: type II secretion system minor pseudopilin GspK [Maricaulaceae bacterium]|jgi:general secretion pathway protein K